MKHLLTLLTELLLKYTINQFAVDYQKASGYSDRKCSIGDWAPQG